MKKIMIFVLMSVLFIPNIALAVNQSDGGEDVFYPSPNTFEIVTSEYYKAIDVGVEETETTYIITGTAYSKWTEDNCAQCCARQLVLSWEEIDEPIECIYSGCPRVGTRKEDFRVEVEKTKISNIIDEHGTATLLLSRHSQFGCSNALSQITNNDMDGVEVYQFGKPNTISNIGMILSNPSSLIGLVIFLGLVGSYIYFTRN